MIKQVSAIPWIAETTVALEQLGYTEDEIARMLSDKRRMEGLRTLEAALSGQSAKEEEQEASGEGSSGNSTGDDDGEV
jgi:hypothetical protein